MTQDRREIQADEVLDLSAFSGGKVVRPEDWVLAGCWVINVFALAFIAVYGKKRDW